MSPEVSIIVPHFQTAQLVKLCLRSIRKFTQGIRYEVIVIDNASKDGASLEYLRSLDWIRLIERPSANPNGSVAHAEAVEIGLQESHAPFAMTIHTDTIPIRNDWLSYHLDPMRQNPRIAAIGTDKLVLRSKFQETMRFLEDIVMWWKRFRPIRLNNRLPYIRSHCAIYRRDVLNEHDLHYDRFPNRTAGQGFHVELERFGYQCVLLDPRQVIQRVAHLNHATEILLPELRSQCKTIHLLRGDYRLTRFFQRRDIVDILSDETLDEGVNHTTDEGSAEYDCRMAA